MRRLPLLVRLALSTATLYMPLIHAAEPTVAPLPPVVLNEVDVEAEPEIRILRDPQGKKEEYRVNGRLYMIKVIPSIGAPYYLYDEDGSGEMKRLDHRADRPVVPRWVLFNF